MRQGSKRKSQSRWHIPTIIDQAKLKDWHHLPDHGQGVRNHEAPLCLKRLQMLRTKYNAMIPWNAAERGLLILLFPSNWLLGATGFRVVWIKDDKS